MGTHDSVNSVNFPLSNFIVWPPHSSLRPSSSILICVAPSYQIILANFCRSSVWAGLLLHHGQQCRGNEGCWGDISREKLTLCEVPALGEALEQSPGRQPVCPLKVLESLVGVQDSQSGSSKYSHPLFPCQGPDFDIEDLLRLCIHSPLRFCHLYNSLLGLIFSTFFPLSRR